MRDTKTSSELPDGVVLRQTVRPAKQSPLTRIAWARDGSRLALPSRSGTVDIWNAEINRIELEIQSSGATWATAVAWSAKGDLVAVVTGDKRVRLWNVIRGNRVLIRNGRRLSLTGTTIAWSSDGYYLAFAPEWQRSGAACAALAIPALVRRSGRIPAEPYPPPRCCQYRTGSIRIARTNCRQDRRRGITDLVLPHARWPVLR